MRQSKKNQHRKNLCTEGGEKMKKVIEWLAVFIVRLACLTVAAAALAAPIWVLLFILKAIIQLFS